MTLPGTSSEAALLRRFEAAGQAHVLAALPRLDPAGRARLLEALASIDLELVARLARLARESAPHRPQRFDPPAVFPLRRAPAYVARAQEARARGAGLLAAGRVGYLVVAGGQASRLGFDAPKGCFPAGPLTGRSLYELFARKIRAARARHGGGGAWYVMTSQATDAATREFFAERRWFGLEPADVVFFRQAVLPALDADGRILMSAPDAPFLAPNGHGGVLAALATSGALDHARERGIEHFSYFQIDNPLTPVADPLFLGLHALEGARMSSKVVRKRDPYEKVGVLGRVDGSLSCIEYSDLPEDLRLARGDDGGLLFWAGNIALHVIDRAFVEELNRGGLQLPWHVARKRIPAVDADGRRSEVEGTKFETFVFDALAHSPQSVILEVERAAEFSPIKNREGEDSPASARRDQCRLFARWAVEAGLELPAPAADGVPPIEIDPLFAEGPEELRARTPCAPRSLGGGHLYEA